MLQATKPTTLEKTMSRKHKRLMRTITAQDENGQTYEIYEHQTFIETRELGSDKYSELAGRKELSCNLGPVNLINETTFQIVATDTQVKQVI